MPPRPSVAKGLLAGLAAGLAATLVMDQFQNLLAEAKKAGETRKKLAQGESREQIAEEQRQKEQEQQDSEGSTEVVARRIAEAAGCTLSKESRKSAGQAVHYTFGTLMGVVYGAAAELAPKITAGGGTAFGSLLFIGADEIAVPALDLASPVKKMPVSSHIEYWAAHLVYGAALELARKTVRRLL